MTMLRERDATPSTDEFLRRPSFRIKTLDLARQVQRDLLPGAGSLPIGVDVAAECIPASRVEATNDRDGASSSLAVLAVTADSGYTKRVVTLS
jgi:hypothetical protein